MQHGLKMYGYIERLASLGFVMDVELSVDLILQSLPDSYASFVLNYQMNRVYNTIPELINMLKAAEEAINKQSSKSVMVVGPSTPYKSYKKKMNRKKTTSTHGGVSKKGKQGVAVQTAARKRSTSEGKCFHCGGTGHWKRNCKAFLESLKKEHGDASSSGINVVEINASTAIDNQTWVLDTGCGSHLVSSMQGLRSSRKVEKRDVDLRVANGARVAALAIGLYHLFLPS